jgi:histidinol phosphatase-like enzyme (inositol monophosphatase family)
LDETENPPNPDTRELQELLKAAEASARAAGDLTLDHFGGILATERKGDGTPVTAADRAAELLIRKTIAERFPGHGILGEEFGESNPGARIRWIVDPIDGTRSFMRGVPLYGVLIGIEIDQAPAVGVAHFPALGETVSAARGLGCNWNGRPARVSGTETLAEAAVLTTDLRFAVDPAHDSGFSKLVGLAALARTWGDCYGHALVATGRADVMVDPVLSPWDAAPLLTIVTEAGGRFTDVTGRATVHGGSGVSTNGTLHDEVLTSLAGAG